MEAATDASDQRVLLIASYFRLAASGRIVASLEIWSSARTRLHATAIVSRHEASAYAVRGA